jgi:DNA-binding CsgD family transcriptional regulator
MTLRVFIRGAAEALRPRLASDPNIELVDRIEQAEAILSVPPAFARDDGGGLRRGKPAARDDGGGLRRGKPAARDDGGGLRRGEPTREYAAPVEALTAREHDVLALVADGLPNRDIAARLAISEHTVKFHLASIFGKLGVSTRTEAVQRGLRLGVIEI